MKRRRLRTIALMAMTTSLGCAAIFAHVRKPTDDPIRVPHETHMKSDVDCSFCHESIESSTSLGGKLLPDESKCMECHSDDKASGNCNKCHTNVKKAGPFLQPDKRIVLSHQLHLKNGAKCESCHKQLPGEHANPEGALPVAMATCRGCHNHDEDYKDGRCTKCHTDLSRYPLKPVADFSHDGNFVKEHPRAARAAAATCAQCHEQTFCEDCHAKTTHPKIEIKFPEKVDSDFIHRNDFLSRHSLDASSDPAMCRRCHSESFCVSCHTEEGLTSAAKNPLDPHPPGWSWPASPNFHGPEARRDITRCAACHDQGPATICINCHKVGGIGGDPHPSGFADRHPLSEIPHNSMCTYCHL